jgi:excinuclease ABC subunit A
LGQPLNTLSGGESQRLKLVGHLAEAENVQRSTSMNREKASDSERIREQATQRRNGEAIGNLFIFDEPTTGLHFDDVAMLLQLFQRLVDRGHSIVVIEHNLEVIKCADWIIDLGPEAGEAGGEVVATGTPEQIAEVETSHTGKFLRQILGSAGMLPLFRRIAAAQPALPVGNELSLALRKTRGRMPAGLRRTALPSRAGPQRLDPRARRARAQSQEHRH